MPPASGAFFPLDEELELGPETFDPWLVESIVVRGPVAPFERVPVVMDRLLRVPVSVETARRLTERIGRTQEQREDAEAERVRATLPMPATGPAVQAHTFKHGDPEAVLTALRTLDLDAAVDPEAATHQAEALAYFEQRRAQITYADFRTQG